jgi:hypothetical protein
VPCFAADIGNCTSDTFQRGLAQDPGEVMKSRIVQGAGGVPGCYAPDL